MDERKDRQGQFSIDENFEQMLMQMNKALLPVEDRLLPQLEGTELPPVVFFCYAPRTGSSMISQYLARTGAFSYVSNITARFWEAPYMALRLEQQLNLRDPENYADKPIKSKFGVTSLPADPHEFGFFWRKILTTGAHDRVEPELANPDTASYLKRKINAMRSVFDKPFFFKNGLAGYNSRYLKSVFPDARFIVITRHPFFIAQSLYLARKTLYKDTSHWCSLRPAALTDIISGAENEFDEIALQIKHIYKDIYADLAQTDFCLTNYEAFCEAPKSEVENIMNYTGADKNMVNWNKLPDQLKCSNVVKVSPRVNANLTAAIENHNLKNLISRTQA